MEYPKALYLHGEVRQVATVSEEESARADGYQDWLADHEGVKEVAPAEGVEPVPTKRPYHRKPKAE